MVLLYYKHSVVLFFSGLMNLAFVKYSLHATAFYTFKTTAFHPNFVLVIPNVFLILLSSFSVGNELHFLRGETVFI